MGWRVYLMALMEAIFRSMGIVSPILLEKMIIWVADKDAPDDEGYIIAALLFVGPFIAAMCTTHNYHLATRAWQHVRAWRGCEVGARALTPLRRRDGQARVAISMVVFEKALSVSGFSAVKGSNSGKTLQLVRPHACCRLAALALTLLLYRWRQTRSASARLAARVVPTDHGTRHSHMIGCRAADRAGVQPGVACAHPDRRHHLPARRDHWRRGGGRPCCDAGDAASHGDCACPRDSLSALHVERRSVLC